VKCDGGQEGSLKRPETIAQELQIRLRTDQYQEAAEAFSARYGDFQPEGQMEGMLGRVEELAGRQAFFLPRGAIGGNSHLIFLFLLFK